MGCHVYIRQAQNRGSAIGSYLWFYLYFLHFIFKSLKINNWSLIVQFCIYFLLLTIYHVVICKTNTVIELQTFIYYAEDLYSYANIHTCLFLVF